VCESLPHTLILNVVGQGRPHQSEYISTLLAVSFLVFASKKALTHKNSLAPLDEFDARVLISKSRGAYNLVNEFAPNSLDSGFESRTSTRINISRLPVSMRGSILSVVQAVQAVCASRTVKSGVYLKQSPNLFSTKSSRTLINKLCN
jgi:hypothetical protein